MNRDDNLSANRLMDKIVAETKRYNDTIKNDRPFSEAMVIRKEIKRLTYELKLFLQTHHSNSQN